MSYRYSRRRLDDVVIYSNRAACLDAATKIRKALAVRQQSTPVVPGGPSSPFRRDAGYLS
jgi:hypothetical protein